MYYCLRSRPIYPNVVGNTCSKSAINATLDDDIEHLPAVQSLAALMLFLSAIYYKHVIRVG